MKFAFGLATALVVGLLGSTVAIAQLEKQQPAEFPPSAFKGKQYVDSNGCVFIRAGIDGAVSWVPRVSRDRKVVCGFQPSLAAAEPAPVPAVDPNAETPAPVDVAQAETSTESSRDTSNASVTVAAAQPAPRPRPRVIRQTAPGQPILRPRPVAQPADPLFGLGAPLAGSLSAITAGAQLNGGRSRDGAIQVSPTARILPRHVAETRETYRDVRVPEGYKSAWDDDRLNPRRAEQTLQGRSQMLLSWTQTLPRRLIDLRSGRDVTASQPLVYPYTTVARQRRELGVVSFAERNGQRVKRIQRSPVFSTRSAPRKELVQAPITPRTRAVATAAQGYLQVGQFISQAEAERAARRISNLGLPARIGKKRQSGRVVHSVQAGPFVGDAGLQTAGRTLKRGGFGRLILKR